MKEKVKAVNIIALIVVIILSLIIIISSAYLAAFGAFVQTKNEPMQIFGLGFYPNTNAEGEPISYSAVLYNANLVVSKGNAVAYFNEDSSASCKLNTAYFYESAGDDTCTLYNDETAEYFDISSADLRGRAVNYIPYLGAILSFASTFAGIVVFGLFGLIVLVLLIVYIVTFAKRFSKKKSSSEVEAISAQEQADAEEHKETIEQAADLDVSKDPQIENDQGDKASEDKGEIDQEDLLKVTDIKAKEDTAYITAIGPVSKVTKLEKALKALKDKKGFSLSVEPADASPAGSIITCEKDKLAVIIALIKTINS